VTTTEPKSTTIPFRVGGQAAPDILVADIRIAAEHRDCGMERPEMFDAISTQLSKNPDCFGASPGNRGIMAVFKRDTHIGDIFDAISRSATKARLSPVESAFQSIGVELAVIVITDRRIIDTIFPQAHMIVALRRFLTR